MRPANPVNQLVLANVVGIKAGEQLIQVLTRDGFFCTQIDSRGGLLREATVSILIGLDRERLPTLLKHIRKHCRTRRRFLPMHTEAPFLETQPVMIEAETGGATVYAFDVERFEQF